MDEISPGAFAYHPLLRELLAERLEAERDEEDRLRAHAAVAPVIAAAGQQIEAIEHWIEARSWPEAVAALEREGPALVRSSAGLMWRWIAALPAEFQAMPTIRSLKGQLEWGAGDHHRAVEALREAVEGFVVSPNPPAEWFARFVLADSLFAIGRWDELAGLAAGWERPEAAEAGVLAAAVATYVAIGLATIGRLEESDRLAAEARKHPDAELLRSSEALRVAFRDGPQGPLDEVLGGMEEAVESLQRADPFNRLLYFQVVLAQMHSERGYPERALEVWEQVREGASGGAGPFLADTTRAWCAVLYAADGRLQEAE